MNKILIVESPAKAKTINKYLPDFDVVATYGHVRDLPSKNGSVLPQEDFKMLYEINSTSVKHVDNIIKACKNADEIYLATDPDREGESISWHVVEILKQKKALKANAKVKRVVFNAITRDSVQNAVKNPRDIDENLVNAQQARRALDYLVGFGISPILWRKLPGSKSAGRVQSVALRLICEREREIEKFKTQEYYTIEADFKNKNKFHATLFQINNKKLEKFDLNNDLATSHLNQCRNLEYFVSNIEKKKIQRNPQPPFTTSTLQQEASRKLGFSTKMTMQIAQKLYEGIKIGDEIIGLITYMRTDGVQIAQEALDATRVYIHTVYGEGYLPKNPRLYQTKAKNAQEAHEAIRPTSLGLPPEKVRKYLDDAQYKLYELIWKRLVASQMESAILDSVAIISEDKNKNYSFKSTGSTINFDGFYRVYREGVDDNNIDDNETILPTLNVGDKLSLEKIEAIQHFTEPPPRFTEASLVKKLEELGIGRPSTYSSIISVIQDRKYVKLDKKRFIPEDRGLIVTVFLENFFNNYVEYSFTANLENNLDFISSGEIDWKFLLKEFWVNFDDTVKKASNLKIEDIIEILNNTLLEHYFGSNNLEARKCPNDSGTLGIRLSKFGAFIGCSNYPDCDYKRSLDQVSDNSENDTNDKDAVKTDIFPIKLGQLNGGEVTIRKGPYGLYIQNDIENSKTPKRVSIPKSMDFNNITIDIANKLLSLPLNLGKNPNTGLDIQVGIGKFGPYLLHDKKYVSIKKPDFINISLNEAIELIEKSSNAKPKKALSPALVIENYEIFKGAFGSLYLIQDDKKITFPKKTKLEDITIDSIKMLLNN